MGWFEKFEKGAKKAEFPHLVEVLATENQMREQNILLIYNTINLYKNVFIYEILDLIFFLSSLISFTLIVSPDSILKVTSLTTSSGIDGFASS